MLVAREKKFFEAAKLNPSDADATRIVRRIDELFGIDAQARHRTRPRRAPCPAVGSGQAVGGSDPREVEAARDASLPSSALGKAANYTLSLWGKLTRFLEHPELELSNNLAENSMRPVALGRKNWIHVGTARPARKVAAILSIRGKLPANEIPIREYLAGVLPGLADKVRSATRSTNAAAWAAARQ